MIDFINTLYDNGDAILYNFYGDMNFNSAKYRIINTIMFILYEPAIIFTEITGCLLLIRKSVKLNNVFLAINGFMLLGGVSILLALIFPSIPGKLFEGEWIVNFEEWIHDFYFWVNNYIIWGVAHLFGITYKQSNILLFVIMVPASIVILNSIALTFTHKKSKSSWCWWINLSMFALCFIIGLFLFIKLGLGF